jgi:hypothetical protein
MKMTDLRAKARAIFGPENAAPMPKQPNGAKALQERANARPIPTYKVGGSVKKGRMMDGGLIPTDVQASKLMSTGGSGKSPVKKMHGGRIVKKANGGDIVVTGNPNTGGSYNGLDGLGGYTLPVATQQRSFTGGGSSGGRSIVPNPLPPLTPTAGPTISPAVISQPKTTLSNLTNTNPPRGYGFTASVPFKKGGKVMKKAVGGTVTTGASAMGKIFNDPMREARKLERKTMRDERKSDRQDMRDTRDLERDRMKDARKLDRDDRVRPTRTGTSSGTTNEGPPSTQANYDSGAMKKGGKVTKKAVGGSTTVASTNAKVMSPEMMRRLSKDKSKDMRKSERDDRMDRPKTPTRPGFVSPTIMKTATPVKKAAGGAAKVRKGMMSPEGKIIHAMNKIRGK